MNTPGNNTIDEAQGALIREFAQFGDNWLKKYEHLVRMGNSLPPMDPRNKTDDNLIRGCQSQVWLHSYQNNGTVHFEVDCDSQITKGIAAVLVKILSGQNPDAIQNAELYSLDEIGLRKHLSPTRSNGLDSMVKQMKNFQENGDARDEKNSRDS